MAAGRPLATRTRVRSIALRDYGRGAKPHHLLGIAKLAEVSLRILKARAPEHTQRVGNCRRCQIMAECAVRYPERVAWLALQAPSVDAKARRIGLPLRRPTAHPRYEHGLLTAIFADGGRRAGVRRAWGIARLALAYRIVEKWPKSDAATLMVRGQHDLLLAVRGARDLAAGARPGELREVRGRGHAVPYAAPDAFAEVVRPFLRLCA